MEEFVLWQRLGSIQTGEAWDVSTDPAGGEGARSAPLPFDAILETLAELEGRINREQ